MIVNPPEGSWWQKAAAGAREPDLISWQNATYAAPIDDPRDNHASGLEGPSRDGEDFLTGCDSKAGSPFDAIREDFTSVLASGPWQVTQMGGSGHPL